MASVASSIDAIIRPQREALFSMRNCIISEQTDTRGEDIATASSRGVYSDEGWDRTKEENDVDSECLATVWNQSVTGTTVLQTFLGSSGYIKGYFTDLALNVNSSSIDETSDARTNPNFVSSTTFQKQVVIMMDFSNLPEEDGADFLAAMKLGSHAVIQGLSDLDSIQVVTSVPGFEKGFNCGGEKLLRGTESNKKAIMDYVDTLTSPGPNDPSHLTPLEIFFNAFNLTPFAGSEPSCQPLFLYVSANQFAKGNVREITALNEEYGARIFTYAIQSTTDPEGYLGGGSMYNLACENDGSWYNVQTADDVPNKMLQYQMIVQRSRTVTEPTWRVNFPSYGGSKGLVISGALPVFLSSGGTKLKTTLVGVVVVEFTFADIQEYLLSLKVGLSFAFLTTWNADLLIHPIYRDPEVVSNLPLYYDVTHVESSENFVNEVRGLLVSQRAGEKSVLVDRPLPRGDTGTVGYSTTTVNTTFFWSQLQSLPFTVVLAYTESRLRSPFFTANNETGPVVSTKVGFILDQPDVLDYVPDDYFDYLTDRPGRVQLHFKYVHCRDNIRSYDSKLAQLSLSQMSGGILTSDSFLQQPDSVRAIHTYLNNLKTPFNQNPGLLADFKGNCRIGSQIFDRWRADSAMGNDVPGMFRFAGFSTDSSVHYPGLVYLPSTLFSYASARPWYQKAESNPRVSTISSPYSDQVTGEKVTTVAQAILEDPDVPLEDIFIYSVVGVDFPYPTFHQGFVDATGCAYDREAAMNDGTPMCYVMDNSGLLVITPEFLTPGFNTYDKTNSDTLPVGVAEPYLTLDLLSKGIMTRNVFTNFRGETTTLIYDDDGNVERVDITPIDIPQTVPQFEMNETALEEAGGFVSGILEKVDGYCTSGTYTVTKVVGTNTFLIYIEDYSLDNNEDCRVFDLDSIENITFGTCEEAGRNYPQFYSICPNSDERQSTTERNRPEDAQCDLEPPKEADFVAWGDAAAIAMVTVASVLIFVTLIMWGIVLNYRNTPVFVMSSPVFVYLQFFGFILGYFNIYLWTGEPTDVQCGLRPWIASIAFVLIVGPMFAKTYRIWKLFSGKGFFAKKIPDTTVLFYVGLMLVVPLILCIIWSAYEIPEPTYNDDDFDDDKRTYRCDGDNCRIFEGIMIGYCGCLLVLGSFFAFRARKGSSHFNEARFIGVSIYMITFCGVVGVVLTYVLLGLPIAYYLVFCVSVMFAIFFTTLIVYYPKFRICLFKPEKNTQQSSSRSGSVPPSMDA